MARGERGVCKHHRYCKCTSRVPFCSSPFFLEYVHREYILRVRMCVCRMGVSVEIGKQRSTDDNKHRSLFFDAKCTQRLPELYSICCQKKLLACEDNYCIYIYVCMCMSANL